MRYAHQVRKVRAAEQALMAKVPPGALMQRAAAGLASVSAGLVGKVPGARVVVLAGSGDNGGDALYAAARLARRGAAVLAVTAGSRVHEQAPPRLRDARHGCASPDDGAVPAALGTADLIPGRATGHRRARRPFRGATGFARRAGGTIPAAWSRSTYQAGSTPTPAWSRATVQADVT